MIGVLFRFIEICDYLSISVRFFYNIFGIELEACWEGGGI